MKLRQISLLGIPRVVCEGQETRPQAKETWAVLAALLLPSPLGTRSFAQPPQPQSRQVLADRFWGDKDDPRVYLRQSLTALKKMFDAECFVAERETVRVATGCFVTDIEQMLAAYAQALAAYSREERLHAFAQAINLIQGDFLEGCLHPGDSGEPWMLRSRAEIRGMIVQILMASTEAQIEAEMLPAALETACRVLAWQPEHKEARKIARELAGKTGRTVMIQALGTEEDLPTVLERLRTRPGNALTLTERRLFAVLFQSELAALSPKYRKPFLRLALFPAPFSVEMAKTICRVPAGVLRVLEQTPLVERRNEFYVLPEVVQAVAWRQVPTPTRRMLQKRLASRCTAWLADVSRNRPSSLLPFTNATEAAPFLKTALEWHLQQPPNPECVEFVNGIRFFSLLDLVRTTLPYLERTLEDSTLPGQLRSYSGWCAGSIRLDSGEYDDAIRNFESTLTVLSTEIDSELAANLHFPLSLAHHYNKNSKAAIAHLEQSRAHHEALGDRRGVGQCLRFLCEIQNHYGDYESALIACEEALQIRREIRPRWDSVADALYWKGVTIWRLGRSNEAADCFEEALSIWQETNDTTGIAFCLRMMGRLRSGEGRFAEARAHLEHAILLHDRMGDQGSRIVAVAALADNFFDAGYPAEARTLYAECLAVAEAKQSAAAIENFRAKIARCTV